MFINYFIFNANVIKTNRLALLQARLLSPAIAKEPPFISLFTFNLISYSKPDFPFSSESTHPAD